MYASLFAGHIGENTQGTWLQLQTHPVVTKKKRDADKFAACAVKLADLKTQARKGECQLVYFDEAGFAASPPVQRAWSPLGKPHLTTPANHQRVSVMGALNFAAQRLFHHQTAGTVKRDTFVAFIDDLLPNVATSKPTFIVLDNARIHHGIDDEITRRWLAKHNATLVYLPPYSPELNMIEILWKQAKYHWREFATWSKETFRIEVANLLDGFGAKFQINFT